MSYWNNVAGTKPDAVELATRLGLEFSTAGQWLQIWLGARILLLCQIEYLISSYRCPVRRLIVTGSDSPDNLALLIGPLWESNAADIFKEARIELLLVPPPGSPNQFTYEELDVGCPRWAPRAPSEQEEVEIAKVKKLQGKMMEIMGDRKEVTSADVKQMVLSVGNNWAGGRKDVENAINTMDQGVER